MRDPIIPFSDMNAYETRILLGENPVSESIKLDRIEQMEGFLQN